MTVVFVPDYTGGNPYQGNLATALEEDVLLGGVDGALPVVRALWSRDVSVVHYHWVNQYFHGETRRARALSLLLFAVQVLAVRLSGAVVVWTVHNVRLHEATYPRLEYWFKRWFVRSETCDRLVVHCEAVVDDVIDEFDLSQSVRDRIDVVPHGHYLDDYPDELSAAEARADLGLEDAGTVFLFFGLIRRYKGVTDLVEAFGEASIAGSHLLVAGNPQTDALAADLDRRVGATDRTTAVFEFVPDDEIQRYMNAADVVVLPFRETTTSGSAVLAMSFGRALVVPRLGCLPELVDEAGAVAYDPNDPDGLRDALRRAASRDTDAMGTHNRERVAQFDWPTIARATERTYARAGADAPLDDSARVTADSV